MRVLLDTHTFLWTVDDSASLPKRFREIFNSGEHEMFVSVVSLWKIAIKVAQGKLTIPVETIQALVQVAEERDTHLLAVQAAHLDLLRKLPMYHRDPFDRLIVCQAKSEAMMLASVDGAMRRYDVKFLA